MCGLVSFLSLHPSRLHHTFNSSPHPVPGKPIYHASRQGGRFSFISLAKAQMFGMSVDVPSPLQGSGTASPWMTSLEPSLPEHSWKTSSPVVSLKLPSPASISQPMCWGQRVCVATPASFQRLMPLVRQILTSIWKISYLNYWFMAYLYSLSTSPIHHLKKESDDEGVDCRTPDLTPSPCVILELSSLASFSLSLKWGGWNWSFLRSFCLKCYDFKPLGH